VFDLQSDQDLDLLLLPKKMKFLSLVFVSCLLSLTQVGAQYIPEATVVIDKTPYGQFSTHFTCKSIDPLLGYAVVNFVSGSQAYPGNTPTAKSVVFSDGTATGAMSAGAGYTRAYNQPGTHWAYLRDLSTSNIVDYVQIEIVTHGVYNGDCYTRMTTDENGNPGADGGPFPPDGWDSGSLPPAYTPSNN